MKKRFGLIAMVLGVAVLFSSCEFIAMAKAMKQVGQELTDYDNIYVTNNTNETITVIFEEDPDDVAEGETRRTGIVTLKSGASDQPFLSKSGRFKLFVENDNGNVRIIEKGWESDTYHYINGHSLVTITKEDGKYFYSSKSRG
ncbi:hypothetical protein SAMN04487977_101119 [Treponema bryantii]|uniref:Lipoprotein n=1 Tax=Treponema bryantii TaxID=163 RepID=A0A1H8ZX41_9SPIR|nr:hypothetical protein [Treponema bryantii]SEP68807.1 hypothetical protein SAMN04487977_101119 [Treponema bryantii]